MSIDILQGLGAYQRTLGRAVDKAPGSGAEAAPVSFASLVQDMVANTGQATRHAEAASMKAVAGKATLVDVVTSVSAAETQLETLVAVRDRVVAAYQDIMRMSI